MMVEPDWKGMLRDDPTSWLLEPDPTNPGVRFMTLRDLDHRPPDDPELAKAGRAVMKSGPVPVILDAQDPEGFWVKAGPGYGPKYRSTVWSLISLAQLGASADDSRIRKGCEYYLEHAISKEGALTMTGSLSGSIYCLTGNMIAALIDLGYYRDKRLDDVLEWLVRAAIGEGTRQTEDPDGQPFYLKSGMSGPIFECSANNRLPCAWGGLKVMHALTRIPENERSKSLKQAIDMGSEFFLSRDPAEADYPMGWSEKPNRSWWKLGYPIFYVSDILEILEVLSALGFAADERLDHAFDVLLDKQDERGRWPLEYTYNGKTWVDVEEKGKPSKWVTLRALRVIHERAAAAG